MVGQNLAFSQPTLHNHKKKTKKNTVTAGMEIVAKASASCSNVEDEVIFVHNISNPKLTCDK